MIETIILMKTSRWLSTNLLRHSNYSMRTNPLSSIPSPHFGFDPLCMQGNGIFAFWSDGIKLEQQLNVYMCHKGLESENQKQCQSYYLFNDSVSNQFNNQSAYILFLENSLMCNNKQQLKCPLYPNFIPVQLITIRYELQTNIR